MRVGVTMWNRVTSYLLPSFLLLLCFTPTIAAFSIATWIIWSSYLGPTLAAQRSANWLETPCELQEIELEIHEIGTGNRRTTVETVRVRYTFEWNGQHYTSTRYDFYRGEMGAFVEENRRYVRAHPAGTRTTCYVNRENPHEAVLRPIRRVGYGLGILAGVLTIGGVAAGIPVVVGVWRSLPELRRIDQEKEAILATLDRQNAQRDRRQPARNEESRYQFKIDSSQMRRRKRRLRNRRQK